MKRWMLMAALSLCACGRGQPPGAQLDYRPPDGSFAARVPGDWKVDESPGETRKASFFGPSDGERPFSQSMGVYFHAAADPAAAARNYLAFQSSQGIAAPSPAKETDLEVIAERTLNDIHAGRQRLTTRTVVVIMPKGFFSLEHTWPAGTPPSPAFDELRRTFRGLTRPPQS